MPDRNVREATQPGVNVGQKLLLALLGLFAFIGLSISASLKISASLTGVPAGAVSWNPVATIIKIAQGSLQWTGVASIILVVELVIIVGCVVGFVIAKQKLHQNKKRIDSVQKYLAGPAERRSMYRENAVKHTTRLFKDEEFAQKYPGLMLGHEPGKKKNKFFSTWEDMYLVVFGPGGGKTTSLVIPAIVDAPGVVLTTSNKSDIVYDTIKVTQARGKVWVFDPQRLAANFSQDKWFFDPLDALRDDNNSMDTEALKLADIFFTSSRKAGKDSGGGNEFFANSAKILLSNLFIAAAISDQPITEVFRWVSDPSITDPLTLLADAPEWSDQYESLSSIYNLVDATRSGVFGEAKTMSEPLSYKNTQEWITPSDDAKRFVAADFVRSKADTLYVLSKEGAGSAAALTTALTATVCAAAERYGELNGGRLPVPFVAALDEAANTVRWPDLPALYSHYRARSIILMTILQSYLQGVGVWGEEGMGAMWSAASILMVGPGVKDEKMLSMVEKMVGQAKEKVRSVSSSKDGTSVSSSLQEHTILTVADLTAMEKDRALMFSAQHRPMLVELAPYWKRDWPQEIRDKLGA